MSGPRRGGFPGPFRRLGRQPLRVLAIALLAVTALAAAGIQSVAAAVLRETVSADWRGAYDILVTPPDGIRPINGELPPNSLSSTTTGMTLADLAKVRKVAGVDVAAPIGQILVPGLALGQAQLTIPASVIAQAAESAQAYQITETYTTDDGLGERVVSSHEYTLVVDHSAATKGAANVSACLSNSGTFSVEGSDNRSYPVDRTKYPALLGVYCGNDLGNDVDLYSGSDLSHPFAQTELGDPGQPVNITIPDAMQSATRITLVDPVAEKKLLGKNGDFLDPLIAMNPSGKTDYTAMENWAKTAGGPYAAAFTKANAPSIASELNGAPPSQEALTELRQLFASHGDNFDTFLASQTSQPSTFRYLPLLVSQQPVADMTLKLDIKGAGGTVGQADSNGEIEYGTPSGGGKVVGTTAGNVSGILNPFVATAKPLAWPGSDATSSTPPVGLQAGQIRSIGRPAPARYTATDSGAQLAASSYQSPLAPTDGNDAAKIFSAEADPTAPGAEAVFNGGATSWTFPTEFSFSAGVDPAALPEYFGVPIGSFDPARAADQSAASYVPLGAYGDVASTVGSGPRKGATLQPSVTGMGLVSSRTAAIASLGSAALWDTAIPGALSGGALSPAAPIDAIRVRVGGISGYSAAAVQKVVDVANAIDKLGLKATVVAGSSLTDAGVTVTGYAFGTDDPAGKQTVGTIGTVTQRWSELGAASRVSLSVGTSTYVILGIGLAAAILLMGAALLVGIPARREQATVMRELGFSRARITRWNAAEEAPGLVIIAAVGAAALVLGGGEQVTVVTVAAAVAAVFAAGVASVVAGSGRSGARRLRDARSRRIGARSVRGFGARQVRVHALTAVLNGVAVLVVGLAAAGLLAAVLTGRTEAGRSALALLTLGRLLAPQLALGIAGIVCGVLLARLMRRIDLARRAEQWALLRAAGWTAGQLARAQRTEAATVAAPALVVAAVVAAAGAHWLGLSAPWLYLAVAAGAGAITAVAMAGTPRKGASA